MRKCSGKSGIKRALAPWKLGYLALMQDALRWKWTSCGSLVNWTCPVCLSLNCRMSRNTTIKSFRGVLDFSASIAARNPCSHYPLYFKLAGLVGTRGWYLKTMMLLGSCRDTGVRPIGLGWWVRLIGCCDGHCITWNRWCVNWRNSTVLLSSCRGTVVGPIIQVLYVHLIRSCATANTCSHIFVELLAQIRSHLTQLPFPGVTQWTWLPWPATMNEPSVAPGLGITWSGVFKSFKHSAEDRHRYGGNTTTGSCYW